MEEDFLASASSALTLAVDDELEVENLLEAWSYISMEISRRRAIAHDQAMGTVQ